MNMTRSLSEVEGSHRDVIPSSGLAPPHTRTHPGLVFMGMFAASHAFTMPTAAAVGPGLREGGVRHFVYLYTFQVCIHYLIYREPVRHRHTSHFIYQLHKIYYSRFFLSTLLLVFDLQFGGG